MYDREHTLPSARPWTDSVYRLQLLAATFVRPARVSDQSPLLLRLLAPVAPSMVG